MSFFLFIFRWPHHQRQSVELRLRSRVAGSLAATLAAGDSRDPYAGHQGGPTNGGNGPRSDLPGPEDQQAHTDRRPASGGS